MKTLPVPVFGCRGHSFTQGERPAPALPLIRPTLLSRALQFLTCHFGWCYPANFFCHPVGTHFPTVLKSQNWDGPSQIYSFPYFFSTVEVNVLLLVNNSLCETLPLQIAAWFLSPEWP